MPNAQWLVKRAAPVVAKRVLKSRRAWKWHHRHIKADRPYERILIQGLVRALHQETFEKCLAVMAKTLVQLRKHLRGK